MDNVLTVRQVARQFNVSEDVVRRWLNDGKIEGKRVGRSWQISREAIDRKAKEDDTWDYYTIHLFLPYLSLTLDGFRGKERRRDHQTFRTDVHAKRDLPLAFWTKFAAILPEGEPWDDVRKAISKRIEEEGTEEKPNIRVF